MAYYTDDTPDALDVTLRSVLDRIDRRPAPPPVTNNSTWIGGGLKAGAQEIPAQFGQLAEVVGKATGLSGIEGWGRRVAAENFAKARAIGRPDLEGDIFQDGIGGVLPRGIYQAAKMVPLLGGAAVAAAVAPQAVVPAALTRLGMAAPAWLGGGAGLTGAAATAAGNTFARGALGLGLAQLPAEVGSMYGQRRSVREQAGEEMTAGDAVAALGLGAASSAVGSLDLNVLRGILRGGTGTGLAAAAKSVAVGGARGAALEVPTAAAQAALGTLMAPDMSASDRLKNVFDAAANEAVVGGILGGAVGGTGATMRTLRRKGTADVSPEDINAAVDEAVTPLQITYAPSTEITPAARRIQDQSSGPVIPMPDQSSSPSAEITPAARRIQDQSSGPVIPMQDQSSGPVIEMLSPWAQELTGRTQLAPAEPAPPARPYAALYTGPQLESQITQLTHRIERVGQAETLDQTAAGQAQIIEDQTKLAELLAERRARAVEQRMAAAAQVREPEQDTLPFTYADPLTRPVEPVAPLQITYDPPTEITPAARRIQNQSSGPVIPMRDQSSGPAIEMLPSWAQELTGRTQLAPAEPAPPARPYAALYKGPQLEGQITQLTRRVERVGQAETLDQTAAGQAQLIKDQTKLAELLAERRARAVEQRMAAAAQVREPEQDTLPFTYDDPLTRPVEPVPVSPQTELPRDALVSSPSAEPVVTAESAAAPFSARDYLRDQAGLRPNQTTAKMVAADPADIVNNVLDRMERASDRRPEPQWVQAAAEHFGLRDAAGQERNLSAEIVALQQSGAPGSQIADLQAKQSLLEIAAARRAEQVRGEASAVQEPGPEGVDVREPTQAGEQVAEGNPQGVEATSQGEAQTGAARIVGQGPAQAGIALPTKPPDTSFYRAITQTSGAPVQATISEPAFARAWDRVIKLVGPNRVGAINVVSTPGELPAHVQAAAEAQGIPVNEIRGVQDRGQTYVVRSNVRNEADLQEVILHEVLGHGGTRALLGSERVDRLTELFDTVGGVEGLRRLARKYKVEKPWSEYIPDRTLNAADKVQVFDEFLAQAAGTATGRTSTALRAWAGELKQGLIALLDKLGMTALARRFEGFSALDTAVMLKRMRAAVNEGRALDGSETNFIRMSPPQVNDAFKDVVQQANALGQKISEVANRTDVGIGVVKAELAVTTVNHMADRYDPLFSSKPIERYTDAQDARGRDAQIHAQLSRGVVEAVQRLAQTKPRAAEAVNTLLKASAHGYNPELLADQHTWKMDKNGTLSSENRKNIGFFNAERSRLAQMQSLHVYHDLRALNEMQHSAYLATNLRDWMLRDPKLRETMPAFAVDPAETVRNDPTIHENIRAMRDFYQKYLTDGLAQVNAYLTEQRNEALAQSGAGRAKVIQEVSPLERLVRNTEQSFAADKQAPYFHLGRTGEWFVAFDISGAQDEKGKVTQADRKSVDAVADALRRAGHENVELVWANDKPTAYVRVERPSEAEALVATLEAVQKQGHIQPKSIDYGLRTDGRIAKRVASQLMVDFRESLEASRAFVPDKGATAEEVRVLEMAKQRSIDQMQHFMLDALPDSAVNKVLVQREGVRGYSADMIQNFARRAQIGGTAIASMGSTPKIAEVLRDMRADIRSAGSQEGAQRSVTDIAKMHGVLNELTRRQGEASAPPGSSVPDAIRAANHAFFTAGSPAYALMQLMSIPQFVLPELGKKHGFVMSGKAIAGVTSDAFKILRAAFSVGAKTDMLHAVDGMITTQTLKASGVSKPVADFIIAQIARGNIDVGSQTREFSRIAEGKIGGVGTNTLRYARAMGYYAETFARLVTVLAAAKLHGMDKPDVHDYARRVNKETQFTFSDYNNSRLLSRSGPAGPLTPIMASFLSWQAQATEKLYREMGVALGGMTGNKAEARWFLYGHLGAMTVLAGTLGLPFASVAARVADKLVDTLGEEGEAGYDIKKAWREFLASAFGKDIGEMLAHGASRGIGVDIAGRVGEQDIIPFSKFLTDRRKARDVAEDLVIRSAGSPVSAAVNIFDGLNDIFGKGDVIQGMGKLLPTALRNQFNAYRLTTEGYVDRNGNQLPMTPGARAILTQAIGFTPSERAEHAEAAQMQRRRESDLEATGTELRKRFAIAVERGDAPEAREVLRQGSAFNQHNPAYALSFSAALARRAQDRETARVLGVPLGANLRDPESYARFMNIRP